MADNAIAFNEGTTFLLVKPLGAVQAGQGQVMVVRDHASGELGVRKRVIGPATDRADYINNLPPEQFFASRVALPTHIPRLLSATCWGGNNAVDYSLIFDFCNGGDLGQLIDRYGQRGRIIPEVFIWHVLGKLTETLAYLHHGQVPGNPPPNDWVPILHIDVAETNIFLKFEHQRSWQTLKKKQLPEVHLGDFGIAIEDPNQNFDAPGDNTQPVTAPHWSTDVYGVGFVLRKMVVARENDDRASSNWQQHFPASYSSLLETWVAMLDRGIGQLQNVQYLVQNLLPVAQGRVAALYTAKSYNRKFWVQAVIKENITVSHKPVLLENRNAVDIPGPNLDAPWAWRTVDPKTYQ